MGVAEKEGLRGDKRLWSGPENTANRSSVLRPQQALARTLTLALTTTLSLDHRRGHILFLSNYPSNLDLVFILHFRSHFRVWGIKQTKTCPQESQRELGHAPMSPDKYSNLIHPMMSMS